MNMKKKRLIFLILLISLLLIGTNAFSKTSQDYFSELVQNNFSDKARLQLLSEAQKQAEARYNEKDDQWKFIYYFFGGYLQAMMDVEGKISVGPGEVFQSGFDSGIAFFKKFDKESNQRLSLEDFGYEVVTAKGTYESGSGLSSFRPSEKNENWWVKFRQGVGDKLVSDDPTKSKNISIDIIFKGYLAPKRGQKVGRENKYDRVLFVTDILGN